MNFECDSHCMTTQEASSKREHYAFFFFAYIFVRFTNSHQLNENDKNNVNVTDLKKYKYMHTKYRLHGL